MRNNFKIGFACKFYNIQDLNFKTIKIKSLEKLKYVERVDKIFKILEYNISALNRGLDLILSWPTHLQMMRIGSDIFPCYTHEIASSIYKKENSIKNLLLNLDKIGEKIKNNAIRISMHPGQYTMLVSKNTSTIENSIKDLEYHADVFRYMNIDPKDQKNAINIHIGAKIDNFRKFFIENFSQLSEDLKSWFSLENDEFSYSIYDAITLSNYVKITLDIHHYWVKHEKFIDVNDPIIDEIIASWRGAIPEMHYSLPKEEYCGEFIINNDDEKINFQKCKTKNKKKLREHSNYCWHDPTNKYVLQFLEKFDIMVEAKAKQLASHELFLKIKV